MSAHQFLIDRDADVAFLKDEEDARKRNKPTQFYLYGEAITWEGAATVFAWWTFYGIIGDSEPMNFIQRFERGL